MNKSIPFLKKGDKICLLSPAKAIEPALVFDAKEFWEKEGYVVEIGEFALGQDHYFSGDVVGRTSDFQHALDDDETKAIICNRGGYGCIQLMDRLNWSGFLKNPKWIVGFSDVTVFHQYLQHFEFKSIHATMPLNYASNSEEALSSIKNILAGNLPLYKVKPSHFNKNGQAAGKLIGGNLSILYSLIGTEFQPDYSNSILFIEDLSEQLYHLDRMFYSFAKAGILRKIKGLVVGGMTDMKDTEIPFGKTYQDIILSHFQFQNIPILFDFPAGHIDDNQALLFGSDVCLNIDNTSAELYYI
jgi:muramoyltetrapeptide carboxypeptidase